MRNFYNKYKTEIWIFAIALIARLVFLGFFYPAFGDNLLKGDAFEYINLAINIEKTHTFSNLAPPSSTPTIADGPIYPLFLVITRVITNVITPLLFQALLGALSALLIFWIGKKLFSKNAGIIAALLFSLEPGILFYTSQIFTETLFTFFLLLAILYLLSGSTAKWAFSGLFLGLAALTRAIALYLLPLFIIYIFLEAIFKNRGFKPGMFWPAIKKSLIIMAIFALVISPWIVRNKKEFGVYAITSGEAHVLTTYTLPAYLSWKNGISFKEAQQKTIKYLESLGIKNGAIEDVDKNIETRATKEISKILFSDPLGYAISQAKFFPQFFFSSGWQAIANIFTGNNEKEAGFGTTPTTSTIRFLGAGFWALVSLLAALGAILAIKKLPNSRPAIILFVLIILMFAFATGALAYSRYRFPVNPLLFLLSSYGCLFVAGQFSKTSTP